MLIRFTTIGIRKCTVNGRTPHVAYNDPYSNFRMHATATIHQHHMLRKKMEGVLHDPPEHELIITLPSKIKIEPADPFSMAAQQALNGRNNASQSRRETPDASGVPGVGTATPALTARPDNLCTPFMPLTVRIEFVIENVRDGFTFVGCDSGDMRYPHAYTTNSPLPGASCCLFPTLDGVHERWTWDIEVTVPKTLGDIKKFGSAKSHINGNGVVANGVNGVNGNSAHHDGSEDTDMEEDSDLDMVVVCSGDFADEEVHATESWKKTVKFTQTQAVAPQHIAIAVGPFERVNLSEYRDIEVEEAMGTMSVDVKGYCLPGRDAELRNTCMFIPKAVDFIVKEFGQYVFSSFKLCFVDDLATDTVEAASLAVCSNRLLFPETIIDPIYPVTRALTYAIVAQWAGVQVVPKDWADIWVIVGIAYWMTGCFLKSLMGNNEYRFRLKKDAEKICELDIGRPSLYAQGFQVPIEPDQLDFIKLKAPVVLTILEKRLWKISSSMVLHRVVRKTFLSAMAGELKNGLMSTAHFIRLCEKNSHTRLDSFFQEWVYGSGYPRFEVSQRFNKKRMIVEMVIRQVQVIETPPRKVTAEDFLKDAREHTRSVPIGPVQPVFTGPMTIRIHEADGTPYEHVVDFKEGYTKLEVPYNTKYKRLKRSRRQKERAAAGAGVDISLDAQNDDVLLYCLGDVLQSEEEIDDWRLEDWSKEEEERMAQESFEWIRMDADFEWICTLNINQPDYMFLSQLQQDRDVIAQYEAIKRFAEVKESGIISSILVRTLMDRRYYYGIRVEAALALAKCATADLDWIGQFHLMKAFQEFFCFPNSPTPRSNDFSEFTAYYVQKAIPTAMSQIRNKSGVCPTAVQKWLLDVLRHGDNSNNQYDDCYYVANLMTALANTLTPSQPSGDMSYNFDYEDAEANTIQLEAMAEIERFQRMDQWQPSYQNIISQTALENRKNFALTGVKDLDLRMVLAYTREGTQEALRVKAFECLIDLGALQQAPLARYICGVMGDDPSPYIRQQVQKAFGKGFGLIAVGGTKAANGADGPDSNDMLIVEDGSENTNNRQDALAKETVDGSIAELKKQLSEDAVLKESIWHTVTSPDIGLIEMRYLLDICHILYSTKTSLIVIMKRPKHLFCKHIGKGVLHFKWSFEPRSKVNPAPPPPLPLPASVRPPGIKLITTPKPKPNGVANTNGNGHAAASVPKKAKEHKEPKEPKLSKSHIEAPPAAARPTPKPGSKPPVKSTSKAVPKATPKPQAVPKPPPTPTPASLPPKAPKIVLKFGKGLSQNGKSGS
ncbi:Transcription initiation factor TFIID subunit 2 [Rhizina undulata]